MRIGWATSGVLLLCAALSIINKAYAVWYQSSDTDSEAGRVCPYLAVVVGSTPWWAVWTLLTAPFVQTKVISTLLITLVTFTGGNYCERCWTSLVYSRFTLITLIFPTFVEVLAGAIAISLFRSRSYLPIYGANGLLAGIMVSLRQLIPGHTIILFRNRIRIQIKWLPATFLVVFAIVEALGLEENSSAFYVGFVTSWYYLRYHQRTDRGEIGDASDEFGFVNLFPRPVAALIEPLVDKVHYILAGKLHLVRQFTKEEIQGANERYLARLSGSVLPTYGHSARLTNERRKVMLRAMERGS